MSALLPILLFVGASGITADRPDLLLADFEGETYPAGWKTTGTAFGKSPAKGTLPNQMPVSGFLGKGLVNSYLGGDGSTGTLTSPPFKIERKYLNFLVGGGKLARTRVDLLVGGKVVRSATGSNDRPGGSEHLDWHTWDVAEFEGKEAVIEIVDGETGGWGHINADHFVQSDRKKQAESKARFIVAERRYLHLPVKIGAAMRRMTINDDDAVVREFDIELADGVEPDFWVFADLSAFKGKKVVVKTTLPADSTALDTLKVADDIPDVEKLYREKHRPLFHFTSRRGWLNDPNGLVYHDNEWHLFYQHNPYGREWGNMHWGHAVSTDLVRWKELGIGLYPKKYGDWAFSGSAVVDTNNTSDWGTKDKPPLVLAYTSTGRGECMAFSNDGGRTWTEYDKNPVVKHQGRDPKLVWYEKGKHWVMAVYDEHDKKQWIAFYTSPDLKAWTFASRIEGFYECPDLFELEYAVKPGSRWVLYGADGKYLTGQFNGNEFRPDHKEKKQLWYGRFYASQTFDNTASQREKARVQIGWAQGVTFPGSPFNQQMAVPVDLFLEDEEGVARLHAQPVRELPALREEKPAFPVPPGGDLVVSKPRIVAVDLDAFDVELQCVPARGAGFTLDLRGTKLVYDGKKRTLTCKDVTAPLRLSDDSVSLRILVDRGSVEVFGHGAALSVAAIPDERNRTLELAPQGGDLTIRSAGVWRMKSAWEK